MVRITRISDCVELWHELVGSSPNDLQVIVRASPNAKLCLRQTFTVQPTCEADKIPVRLLAQALFLQQIDFLKANITSLDEWLNLNKHKYENSLSDGKQYERMLKQREKRINELHEIEMEEMQDLGAARTAFQSTETFAALHNWFQSGFIPLIPERYNEARHYAFHKETVWACAKSLSVEQWQHLIERKLRREQQELDFISPHTDDLYERERIPEEIRIEVWRRDNGRCARCGSQERLEFDHIVPVSKGGGNTARNLELLCELCNRMKNDSIG